MKIAQAAVVAPPLALAVPRVAEGAMLFELPVVSGDGGSGDRAEALDHDPSGIEAFAGKIPTPDGFANAGSIIADSAAVRQLPPPPPPPPQPPPPVAARTQTSLAADAPPIAPASTMELPDPRAATGMTPTMIAAGAPPTPTSFRSPATEASAGPQPVAGPVGAPAATVREIVQATSDSATTDQTIAAPQQTANRIEAAPNDARIAPARPESVVIERQSNRTVRLDAFGEALPVAVARRADDEAASRSTASRQVVSAKRRQIEPAFYPTGPAALRLGEPMQPTGRVSDTVADRTIWLPGHADVDPVAAPAELALAIGTPISSGMTRTTDSAAISPVATLPVLDIDAGGQWIDRLAVEISACAATGGVRLKLSPDNLGELSIAVGNGDSGASVVITAQDEGVRSAIAGAQDRLMAEARAQGVRVADLQTGLAGDNGSSPQQQHRPATQAIMPDRFNQPKRTMPIEVANHERANPAGRWA